MEHQLVNRQNKDTHTQHQPFFSKGEKPFFSAQPVQAKLTIGEPDDPYEREADAMADRVMRMKDNSLGQETFFHPSAMPVQRKCAHCEEEEKKQLQRKEVNNNETVANVSTENYINSLNGNGKSLTQSERSFFEPKFGYDFSSVQLHTNAEANQSAESINALAYTHGNDIVFGANQYQPNTDSGKRLLAHELTHVVQQKSFGGINEKRVQRFLSTEPAGGCGICYGLPRNAGNVAHKLIQLEFEILYPLGLVEFPFSSPTDDNGRLDLAIATPAGLEIGEIKPANENGYANGITDIAFYVAALDALSPNITIRPLTRLIPPIEFPSLSPNCPVQTLYVNPPVGGVYGYWCSPGYSESLSSGCRCNEERREPQTVLVPVPSPQKTPSPVLAREHSSWEVIRDFAEQAIRTGQTSRQAIENFLRAHPNLIYIIIAMGAAGLVATFAEDIATWGAGILDDLVTVPFFARMITIALELRQSIAIGTAAATAVTAQ